MRSSATDEKIAEEQVQKTRFWPSNLLFIKSNVSKGGINCTSVDKRVIFAAALKACAVSVILAHNHPSGNLYPSQADIDLTKDLYKAGEILGIKIVDHLVISPDGFYSFADEGLI